MRNLDASIVNEGFGSFNSHMGQGLWHSVRDISIAFYFRRRQPSPSTTQAADMSSNRSSLFATALHVHTAAITNHAIPKNIRSDIGRSISHI